MGMLLHQIAQANSQIAQANSQITQANSLIAWLQVNTDLLQQDLKCERAKRKEVDRHLERFEGSRVSDDLQGS